MNGMVYMTCIPGAQGWGSCFVHEGRGICRLVVDRAGQIRRFPGVVFHPDLKRACPGFRGEPKAAWGISFGPFENGRIRVVWTVQKEFFDPGDDWGFGREEIDGVSLYTELDENGDFTGPFRLYAVADRYYI